MARAVFPSRVGTAGGVAARASGGGGGGGFFLGGSRMGCSHSLGVDGLGLKLFLCCCYGGEDSC